MLLEIGGVPVDQTLEELAHFIADGLLAPLWVLRVVVSLVLLVLLMLLHLLVLDPVLLHVEDALLPLLVQLLQIDYEVAILVDYLKLNEIVVSLLDLVDQ